MGQHIVNVDGPAGKEVFEGSAFFRGFRMEGKGRPVEVNVEFLLQSFNTPGNEIAPGSDVVGKNFQNSAIRHARNLHSAVFVSGGHPGAGLKNPIPPEQDEQHQVNKKNGGYRRQHHAPQQAPVPEIGKPHRGGAQDNNEAMQNYF
jgi:hypothetical protein